MDIEDFTKISEEKALNKKNVYKFLAEEEATETYENNMGRILVWNKGLFYENKLFPDRDYTYSNNFKTRFVSDEELKDLIERLKKLKSQVNEDNSLFFYYGFMYGDGEFHEVNYNFNRGECEELGDLREELPQTIKIKIYSNIETIFKNNIKNGIIVILKLSEKNIVAEISHEEGEITNQF